MGGDVAAENRKEGGTRMVLELPLKAVTHANETWRERGTIAVRLAKATNAVIILRVLGKVSMVIPTEACKIFLRSSLYMMCFMVADNYV